MLPYLSIIFDRGYSRCFMAECCLVVLKLYKTGILCFRSIVFGSIRGFSLFIAGLFVGIGGLEGLSLGSLLLIRNIICFWIGTSIFSYHLC